MAPRRPTRLLEYANKSSAYPRELLANLDSGELTLIDNTGNEVATNPLSTETSGTGNAVKEITVNGRKIIITKATYLTEHPTIPTSADGTDTAANPGFGGTFNVVSTVTRDGNGHVTQLKTKTITMPSQPTSVSGNAGSADKLKTARTIALSGDVSGSVSFDGSANKTINATLANSGVTADSYGPSANSSPAHGESFVIPEITVDAKGRVTSATERTITLPAAPTSVSGNAGTATKLANARTIALNGDASGSTTFDGSQNVTITASLANTGVTADSYGPTEDTTANAGDSFVVPQVTVDAKGRVTSVTERTITLPATPGSVGTADKLAVARSISLSGGATGSTTFDGSADATINVTSLDATKLTGTVPLSSIPKGAQERLVPVANQTAMLALTSNDVQNGDVVKLEDTGVMYYVADDTLLGSIDAFSVFTAGAASSVPWTGVTSKPSITPAGTIANASVTPEGTVSSTFTGTAANHNHTFTGTAANHNHTFTGTQATINSSYTPEGTVSSTFTGTAANHNHTFTGTAANHNHTFTGTQATINSSYTPAGVIGNATPTGKVSSSFTGSAVISTAPSANTTFNQITGVGSLPTMSASVANKCLKITFGQGSLPTSASVTVASSAHAHNVTASGSVSSTFTGDAHSHTFTGTAGNATATYTPAGTIANKSITPAGTIANASVTPEGTVSSTFTGTAGNATATYTPAGTIANKSITPAGTIANASVTPAGSVASTFTGTAGNATATYTPAGTIANKSITPAGTVKSTFSGNAISHNHTFTGNSISL